MLGVLGLIDVVMIANLLIMVIIGGYETFVCRIRLDDHPDQPEWLSHVNANVLKVKLAMAIIGISSIHLLKTFIEVGDLGAEGTTANVTGENYTAEGVMWQVIIHVTFVLSAVALAVIDRMSLPPRVAGRDPRRCRRSTAASAAVPSERLGRRHPRIGRPGTTRSSALATDRPQPWASRRLTGGTICVRANATRMPRTEHPDAEYEVAARRLKHENPRLNRGFSVVTPAGFEPALPP